MNAAYMLVIIHSKQFWLSAVFAVFSIDGKA